MANSALNQNIVKTALDKLFQQSFTPTLLPGYASVENPLVFNQYTSDRGSEIHEVFRGSGEWQTKGESENVQAGQSRSVNQVTYINTTYAQAEDIPMEFFDDDQHSMVEKIIREMALNGRIKREKQGFSVFRNAFDSSFTGGDGTELINPSHPIATGTQSNEVSGNPVLSETSLNTAITQMSEMKKQDGQWGGCVPHCLLVPPTSFKTACEIVESDRRSATADNDMNVYASKYGIYVMQSTFLGASQGGSDTAWYLLSRNHALNRFERESISTHHIPAELTRNHNHVFSARFRESTGWDDYVGVVGSDGTTA